jgi:glycosyl transferase family 87
MHSVRPAIESHLARRAIIALYLLIYLTMGFYTELKLIELFPIPEHLLQDQIYYNRALNAALQHKDPYANRTIGTGYLYPPQALLIIELFSNIQPFFLRVALYVVVNIALLALVVYGIAKYYSYSIEKVWYWFVLSFGFAPFLELLHIGQINVITMFGLFMMFFWEVPSPVLSSVGLSLAAITKVSPLLFLGYLLVHKRYKVIAVATFATALLSLLSILRYGISPLLTYPDVFRGLLGQFLLTTNSQTLAAKLAVANYPQFQGFLAKLPEVMSQPIGLVVAALTTQYRIVQRTYVLYILLIIILSAFLTLRGKQPKEPLFIITALGMMLAPNILWYHHYVFMLLPLLVWMGWRHLDASIVTWCCIGLLIVQIDRRFPPYGLVIHIFSNLSMLIVLSWQIREFYSKKTGGNLETLAPAPPGPEVFSSQ